MSYKITFESLIEELKCQNPGLGARIVDYYPSGQMEAVIKLDDGSRFRYDFRTRTMNRIQNLGSVDEYMDEREWRKAFAGRLRRRMFMKGLTQGELADVSGVSQVSISTYLNAQATPSAYKVERLCIALGCPASELVNVHDI